MKVKKFLKFYFCAEKLNGALDNLIMKNAAYPCTDGWAGAEKICSLIGEKQQLQKLWKYLDGIIAGLSERDFSSLEVYAKMRTGLKKLNRDERNALRRAVVKFTRRAKRLEDFGEGAALVIKYYCLL